MGLIGLVLIAGLVTGLIVLAVKHKPARIALIGLLIAVPVLVFMFFFTVSSDRPVEQTFLDAPQQAASSDHTGFVRTVDRASWLATGHAPAHAWPEAPGLADVYPSPNSAYEGIAKWAAKALNESLRESRDPIALQVTGDVDGAWLESLAAAIDQRTPAVRARHTDRPVQHGNSPSALLTIKDVSPEPDGQTTKLSVDLDHDENDRRAWVSYTDQPWVEAPAREERNKGWAIGYSVELHPEARLAEQQALSQAIDKLANRAAAAGGSPRHVERDRYGREVERGIESGRWHPFYFTQKFAQPYGSVYRSAVVLSTDHGDPARVANAARQQYLADAQAARQGGQRVRNQWLGGIAFVACIALIYTVLNVVTRGYYLWSLRTMAILLAAGGVLLLIWLA